jgi:hypothetical protein
MVKQFEGISNELWKRFSLNFLVSEMSELAIKIWWNDFYPVEIEMHFFCKLNISIDGEC